LDRVGEKPGVERASKLSQARALSAAVLECRIRNAGEDIFRAMAPISRRAECVLYALELNDDEDLAHHMKHITDGVRAAWEKHRELRELLTSSAPRAITGGTRNESADAFRSVGCRAPRALAASGAHA
jgi:hypothetical protein